MSKTYKAMLGCSVSPELVKRIDVFRGEVPRSRVVERALNQFLEANTIKNLQGSRISSPSPAVVEAPSNTTTTNTSNNPEADGLRDTATHGISRLGAGDVVSDASRKKVNTSV